MKKQIPIILLSLLLIAAVKAQGQQSHPLRITCPPNRTNWVCSGSFAFVNYPLPTTTGSCPTNATVTCSPASGSTFILGSTTVTCLASNSCRETAVCSFTITVAHDNTPPVIQCPTNRVVWTCSPNGTVVNFTAPTATDNFDATPTVVCSPPSGSAFPLGTNVVTCTATDDCGNRSFCSFTLIVRPPLLYAGLCHSVLGLAVLNVNTNDELEVSGLGTNGQDGVRIDLGESQGLRWRMNHPAGRLTGDMEVQVLGKATAGNEVLLSRMSYTYRNGGVSVTPGAASYEFKLLRDGVVVHRRNGRSGSFNLPVCSVVWEPGSCWEDPPFFDHPFLPFCMSFLGLVCPVETEGGPVLADTVVVTPEDPLPPFTTLTGVQILGRNLPLLTLHRERLLMFGSSTQAPLPHLALGQARLVAEDGALAVANLGSSGQDGVRVELGESSGLRWRMKNPVGNPEGDMDIDVIGRTTAGTEVPVRRISHHYRNGRLSVTPGTGSYELKLLLRGQVVFQQGGQTGATYIPSCQFVDTEHCVGDPFAGWSPFVPYCLNILTIECDWETPAGPVRADTLVLTPDDPLPSLTAISAVQILGRNIRNLPTLTLLDERRLTFGGSELRLACPPDRAVPACSTNPVPVTFLPPVVTGGNCSAPPVVTCAPASGSLFPLGETTVVCTATNACGERGVCTFKVTVVRDTVPPVITCPSNIVLRCLCTNQVISLDFFQATATDDWDPNPIIVCVPPSLISSPGVHPVTCTATDNCGNRVSCTFTVTFLQDTTPPVIQCPANISVATCSNTLAVNYSVTATDDCIGVVTVVCVPPSGSQFPVGVTVVNCTATDPCGNQSECHFTVTVKRGLPILSESEPNNALASAQDLGLVRFVSVVGRISPAGDVDYYRFTAVPNSKAWITVDTGGAAWLGANSRDSVLTLYNGAGVVIESDDNDGSGNGADSVLESGDASAIAGAALAGGTYYLSVNAAAAGQIIVPYRLYLTVTTNDIPAEMEANNTAATATTLIPPGLTYGVRNASLNPVGDEDWYTVSVPGPSLLHISLDGDPERDGTGTDTRVELFRMDAVSLLFSANSSASGGSVAEGFVYRLSVPGTYYLRVRSGATAATTGTYRVMVAHCPLPSPPPLGIVQRDGRLSLSWPAALEPCLLRSSHDLRTWSFLDLTPMADGDQLRVELPSTSPHQFFQLVPAGGWSNDTYHCCDANGQNCSEPVDPLTGCPNLTWCHETEDQTVCEPQ